MEQVRWLVAFVRDTWASLVDRNAGVFVGALVVGEAVAGILALSGGRGLRINDMDSRLSKGASR